MTHTLAARIIALLIIWALATIVMTHVEPRDQNAIHNLIISGVVGAFLTVVTVAVICAVVTISAVFQ